MEKRSGIELIAEERQRQVRTEGWTKEHDATHSDGSMALAAASYAVAEYYRRYGINKPAIWPFDRKWWKPTPDDRVRELVKAGALIAAEIDRLNAIKK